MANKSFPTSSKNESEINEPHSSFNFDKRPLLEDHPESKRSDHEDGRRTNQPQNDRQEMAPENDKRTSFGDKDLNLPEEPDEDTFTDGPDHPFVNLAKQVIISCNQQQGKTQGNYLRIRAEEEDGKKSYIVRADGKRGSDDAIWRTYVTDVADDLKLAILENVGNSDVNRKCVLCVEQDEAGEHILKATDIEKIPKSLKMTPKYIQFYQRPKATGSSLVKFESILGTKEKKLLVGFDSDGEPIPLANVKENSKNNEAVFSMITVDEN